MALGVPSSSLTDNGHIATTQDSLFRPDNSIILPSHNLASDGIFSNIPMILLAAGAVYFLYKKGGK